jgi:imidazolonepropionase-like amidohydrolase
MIGPGILAAAAVAFRGATLIDGTGAPPVPDSLLVVSEGRILAVGEATREAIDAVPVAARMEDLTGKWIVPGLVDAHVHAESEDDLRQMLRWGVTAVRLMAEDVAAARGLAVRAREPGSGMPDVFPASPIFTRRGGWWGQDEPPDAHVDRFPGTPEEARAAVRAAKRLGSLEIKVMLDDMAWCRAPQPALPKIDPAVARALIVEARRQNLRVTVHAPELADARTAVLDHATALAHGVLEPLDEDTVARMERRPVYYIPTMDLFEFLADPGGFVNSVLSDPSTTRPPRGLLPAAVKKLRSAGYAEGYRRRYPNIENVRRRLPALRDNLLRLHRAGVPIALGTDMWAFPGLAVSVEMELYVKAGLSPLEAIRSATQTAARSVGAESSRGTLETGKRADFLVLDADPVKNVRNLRAIAAVYKDGRRIGDGAASEAGGRLGRQGATR